MMAGHDHNCFEAAESSFDELGGFDERVGFFLYVAHNDSGALSDHHFRGNTAFAGHVLRCLCTSVIKSHEAGCAHCDTVATALKEALDAFNRVMATKRGSC
jgi:hypothetical protein